MDFTVSKLSIKGVIQVVEFKFHVGQEVEVVELKKKGEVRQTEIKQAYISGRIVTHERYYVKTGLQYGWYMVDKLKAYIDDLDYIDPSALDVINKLLIDAHIDNKNFEAIREMNSKKDTNEEN